MTARLEHHGSGQFAICGELDFQSVAALWRASGELFAAAVPLSVDLREVNRSDSSGVALLVDWLRQAREQGRELRFVNIPSQMRAIIQVADLDELLPVE